MIVFFDGYFVITVEQVNAFEMTEEQEIERSVNIDSFRQFV